MKLAFRFDARAWAEPRARWTVATLAPLLDAPWRTLAPEAEAREGEAIVYVGDPATAPAGAAVVIALREWPAITTASLSRAAWDGVAMPLPHGRLESPSRPDEIPAPWLASLWHVLAREEEREDPRRDQWECFSGSYTRLAALELLETPWVNFVAARLRERLDRWCVAHGAELERVPRWKGGTPFAVALSHDVDDVRLRSLPQALRLLMLARSPGSYAFRGGLTALAHALTPTTQRDPYSQFESWVSEESRRSFRSTFYVVARPARPHEYDPLYTLSDRVPFESGEPTVGAMFHTLAERGFEIGLHGSYESWRDGARLAMEREILAVATGLSVQGIRQHFLRLDHAATWSAQEQAGFTTDATLGYNEAIGFRAGIAAPFHPWDAAQAAGRQLLEVPLTLMDGALFRGLALGPEAAAQKVRAHLDVVEAGGGLAGLLWHPNAAASTLFPHWWSTFAAALDHLVARGAWVTSVGEIAAWWREREKSMEES